MGAYTFRWYVISAPLKSCETGKDVSSAMEPRRASERAFESALVELSTREPKAGCLVAQCCLLTLPPAHPRANLHTHHIVVNRPHTAPHNTPR